MESAASTGVHCPSFFCFDGERFDALVPMGYIPVSSGGLHPVGLLKAKGVAFVTPSSVAQ